MRLFLIGVLFSIFSAPLKAELKITESDFLSDKDFPEELKDFEIPSLITAHDRFDYQLAMAYRAKVSIKPILERFLKLSFWQKHQFIILTAGTKNLGMRWMPELVNLWLEKNPLELCELISKFKYGSGADLPGQSASKILFVLPKDKRLAFTEACLKNKEINLTYSPKNVFDGIQKVNQGQWKLPLQKLMSVHWKASLSDDEVIAMRNADKNGDGELDIEELEKFTVKKGKNQRTEGVANLVKWISHLIELGEEERAASLFLAMRPGTKNQMLRSFIPLVDPNAMAFLADTWVEQAAWVSDPITPLEMARIFALWIVDEQSIYPAARVLVLMKNRKEVLENLDPTKGKVIGLSEMNYRNLIKESEELGSQLFGEGFSLLSNAVYSYETVLKRWANNEIIDSLADRVELLFKDKSGLEKK